MDLKNMWGGNRELILKILLYSITLMEEVASDCLLFHVPWITFTLKIKT